MKQLALFDLDSTLLRGDSDHAWGEFLCEKKRRDPQTYRQRNNQYYQQYQEGTLDIQEFLAFSLAPLAEIPLRTLKQLRAEFLGTLIPQQVAKNIQAQLQQHLDQGDTCVIITATNDFITKPIADYFGANLIATQAEFRDGRYTGQPQGLPCFKANKISRLTDWLLDNQFSLNDFSNTFFYSDSINDLPLLEWVKCPVVVNPDSSLLKIANQCGWPHLPHETE